MTENTTDENPEITSTEEEVAMPAKKQNYEMMTIFSSTLSEEQVKKSIKSVKALLGGDVFYEELWGLRPFAYPIKGQEKGYYVVWNFTQDPQEVKAMEPTLKLMTDVVRYLFMKIPAGYKPVTLKEMDEGMDELRAEKAEKRGETKTASQRRTEKKSEKSDDVKKEKAKPAKAPVVEKKVEAKKAEEKTDKKGKKSLDEKLEDILTDADLGL